MGRTETLKEVLGDVVALNHVKPKYANGVRTALAVGVPLAAAVLFDRHGYHALFPVVGALFVAVNDPGGRYSDRAISVIGAAILFTFSVFVGSVTGDNLWLSAPMLFVWAFVGGYALGISGAPMGIRAAGDLETEGGHDLVVGTSTRSEVDQADLVYHPVRARLAVAYSMSDDGGRARIEFVELDATGAALTPPNVVTEAIASGVRPVLAPYGPDRYLMAWHSDYRAELGREAFFLSSLRCGRRSRSRCCSRPRRAR